MWLLKCLLGSGHHFLTYAMRMGKFYGQSYLNPLSLIYLKDKERAYVSRELNRIRFLRNRIFHHEPIWHWKDLSDQHTSIIKMTNGLSTSAAQYLNIFDQFKNVYSDGKKQIKAKLNPIKNV